VHYECDQIYACHHRAERDRGGLCTTYAELAHIAVDAQFVAGSAPAVIESNAAEYAGQQSERAAGISDTTESAAAERLGRRSESWMREGWRAGP